MVPITFTVSYTLSEYRSLIQEHLWAEMAKRAAAKDIAPIVKPSAFTRTLFAAVALVMCLFEQRRMPVCDFTIDENHIIQKTAAWHLVVSWSEVLAIHRYSQGYLVEKSKGSLIPIPYRCLSSEQASTLGTHIKRWQSELRQAT